MSLELLQKYESILSEYLLSSSENSLYEASILSSNLVYKGIGPDEIIEIHLQSLENILKNTSSLKGATIILQSFNFLLEIMVAYGLAHREYLEKKNLEIKKINDHLNIIQQENAKLNRQTNILKTITKISHTLMRDYNDISSPLKKVAQSIQYIFPQYQIGYLLTEPQTILHLVNNDLVSMSYNDKVAQKVIDKNLNYKNFSVFTRLKGRKSGYQPIFEKEYSFAIWMPIKISRQVICAMVIESKEIYMLSNDQTHFLEILYDLLQTFFKRTISFQEISQQAIIDELTGLYNYRYFIFILKQEVQRAHRYLTPLSLAIIDIDNFKQINDTQGHLTGDRQLKKITKILKSYLRETDILCRYGGDEFVIILPETTLKQSLVTAERLRKAIQTEGRHPDTISFNTTVSIGIAALDDYTTSAQELLKNADHALYQAKQYGRNRVELYNHQFKN